MAIQTRKFDEYSIQTYVKLLNIKLLIIIKLIFLIITKKFLKFVFKLKMLRKITL